VATGHFLVTPGPSPKQLTVAQHCNAGRVTVLLQYILPCVALPYNLSSLGSARRKAYQRCCSVFSCLKLVCVVVWFFVLRCMWLCLTTSARGRARRETYLSCLLQSVAICHSCQHCVSVCCSLGVLQPGCDAVPHELRPKTHKT